MERVVNALNKAANNDMVMNGFLITLFGVLSVRSLSQQNYIAAMESEKDSLAKSNKSIKKTIWDWKQQLYSEAESAAGNALVPLSKLKAIYGEANPPASVLAVGGSGKGDGKSPAAKIVI